MSTLHDTASDSSALPEFPSDIKLVVSDMDGTLLNERSQVPERFWGLLRELLDRGIHFAPASGRQYASVAHLFPGFADRMYIIADNGNMVVHRGETISLTSIPKDQVMRAITTVRQRIADGADLGVVVCGVRSAYIERVDPDFLEHVKTYHMLLQEVENLDDAVAADDVIKLAIYDFANPEDGLADALRAAVPDLQTAVSGAHWVDVMDPVTTKGVAIRRLQEHFHITPDQTVVFADYLNDAAMIPEAKYSFAMANAHPEIASAARYSAPSNADKGVLTVLEHLLRQLDEQKGS